MTGAKENRGTVIMAEQSRMFAVNQNRPSKGSILIKKNGNHADIAVTTDNLRPLKKNRYLYKLAALGRKGTKSISFFAGELQPDAEGNAKLHVHISLNDADGKGNRLDDFRIFIIAAVPVSGVREPMRAALKGEWDGKTAADIEIPEMYNSYYIRYVREKTEQLILCADAFTDTEPFREVYITREWKRVMGMAALPVVSGDAEKQISKYRHFIFTFTETDCYLGIPGAGDDIPDGGESGFRLWKPIKNSFEHGYWMMKIERKTGIIREIS